MMNRSEIAHKIKKYEFKLNDAKTHDQFKYYNNKLNAYKKFIGGGGFEHLQNDAETLTVRELMKKRGYITLDSIPKIARDGTDKFFPELNAMFQKILPSYSDTMTIDSFLRGIKDAMHMCLCVGFEVGGDNARIPSNWCGIDTPLRDFTPLPQWEYLKFNDQYELVEILDDFKTNANMFNTTGLHFSKLTRIGRRFSPHHDRLPLCDELISVDLSGMAAVTQIGSGFLTGFNKLISVDLSGMTAVTDIGSDFLYNCKNLKNVNLSGLSAVTRIDDYVLSRCDNLTNVDLSDLTAVTQIGNRFLSDCNNLTNVNLSGLTTVAQIGREFLSRCNNLTSVDLSGLTAVTHIGDYFLSGCSNLTRVNLSSLTAVTHIGDYFLSDCQNLGYIDLSGMTAVTQTGDCFLASCQNLIRIIGMPNVRMVGSHFLAHSENVYTITGFSRLSSAGKRFMYGCVRVKEMPRDFYAWRSKK